MEELPEDAEEAFAVFLFREEAGRGAVDFETFCEGFRGDLAALRALHDDWQDLSGVLREGRPDSSGLDALTELREEQAARDSTRERYELGEELARGGMGAVLRVWDRDLERHLAMKVLLSPAERGAPSDPGRASRQLGRFLDEARVTGQLDHPGIVSVHDLGVDEEGRCYFTMQLVRGLDLKEVLELHARGDSSWSRERLLGVLLKACEAVAYAHSKGVIHRDLKPANIMVGRFGEVYVMDWGLARVQGERDLHDLRLALPADASDEVRAASADSPIVTLDGHVVGTPSYISPEQAQGRSSELGPRADVYSLGATLYHLLAGSPPYFARGEEPSAQRVLLLALQGPPRPLADLDRGVPPELAAICERAMERSELDRYRGAAELAADLRAYLEGRVVSVYRGGALWELRKWAARNRALAISASLSVLLGAALLMSELHDLAQRNRSLAEEGLELRAGEQVAAAERDLRGAEAADLVRNLRASDEVLLDELERAAHELPPPGPGSADRHQAWLRSARSLATRLALHRELLEELRAGGVEAWELAPQARLVANLEALVEGPGSALAHVERRARLCDELREATLDGLEARARWAALERRSQGLEQRGQGLEQRGQGLEQRGQGLGWAPVLGLLPLGPDPASGLEEFAVVATGEVPARDAAGALVLTAESALVLVLLPRREVTIGAQSEDPAAAHYDPAAEPSEAPVHRVHLAPSLLAKHELTRAQWARIAGGAAPPSSSARLPVVKVSGREARRALRGVGLELPGEALWEAAARGGTATPWWTGGDPAAVGEVERLASPGPVEVDAGAPNPYGFFQTLGNVAEWCADAPRSYLEDRVGAGPGPSEAWVFRGGTWAADASGARVADRFAAPAASAAPDRGLRPALVLDQ